MYLNTVPKLPSLKKIMLSGGRSKLKPFQIRGWKMGMLLHWVKWEGKDITVEKPSYLPMGRVEIIQAVSAFEASRQYARNHGLREEQWLDTKAPKPFVYVIRASDVGQRAP